MYIIFFFYTVYTFVNLCPENQEYPTQASSNMQQQVGHGDMLEKDPASGPLCFRWNIHCLMTIYG